MKPGQPFTTTAGFTGFSLSPDGGKIAYGAESGSTMDVWVLDVPRGKRLEELTAVPVTVAIT